MITMTYFRGVVRSHCERSEAMALRDRSVPPSPFLRLAKIHPLVTLLHGPQEIKLDIASFSGYNTRKFSRYKFLD